MAIRVRVEFNGPVIGEQMMVKCENRVRVGVAAAQKMATGRTDAVQDAARRKQWLAWYIWPLP